MKTGWKIFWTLTTLFLASSGVYAGIGVNLLLQVCYSITKYRITGIDSKYIHIDFMMQVFNPSKLNVGITGYNIDVYLNDTKVSNLSSAKPKTLEGEKPSTLTLPIKIDYLNVFEKVKSQSVVNLFLNKKFDKIIFTFKGNFKGSLLKIPISKDIELKYTLKEIQDIMNEPSTPCPV